MICLHWALVYWIFLAMLFRDDPLDPGLRIATIGALLLVVLAFATGDWVFVPIDLAFAFLTRYAAKGMVKMEEAKKQPGEVGMHPEELIPTSEAQNN